MGVIKPIWSQNDGHHWTFGVSEDDFNKIAQGYGCSECLEDFGGVYLTRCPVCKSSTNVFVKNPW